MSILWSIAPYQQSDDGLFYVRWWGQGSTHPVEHEFKSRSKATERLKEFYRDAPYVRVEMIEVTEWCTRSKRKAE